MGYAIGIDLGGTNIKAAAVTEGGEVLARVTATTSAQDVGAVARDVAEQLATL